RWSARPRSREGDSGGGPIPIWRAGGEGRSHADWRPAQRPSRTSRPSASCRGRRRLLRAWSRSLALGDHGLSPVDLDEDRVALAAAGTNRGATQAAAAAPELVHQRADDAGAGGADRMAQGDGAAVHVDLVLV